MVTPTGDASACTDQLQNGNFDSGPSAWTEVSDRGYPLICDNATCGDGLTPHSGAYVAWLGGVNREYAEVYQAVTVPAGQPATLNYWYQIDSEDTCGYDYGYVLATVGGVAHVVQKINLCTTTATTQWQEAQLDLSDYAGQQIELSFVATTDYWLRSSFFVDDAALLSGASCPAGVRTAAAGETLDPVANAANATENGRERPQSTPAAPARYRR